MEVQRYVNLSYAIGFIIAFITLNKFVGAIWERFERLPNYAIIGEQVTLTTVIALAAAIALTVYCYKREDYRTYLTEVVLELKKVTWPTWDETKRATLVVIMFTIVTSAFIWAADKFWLWATDLILLPGGGA